MNNALVLVVHQMQVSNCTIHSASLQGTPEGFGEGAKVAMALSPYPIHKCYGINIIMQSWNNFSIWVSWARPWSSHVYESTHQHCEVVHCMLCSTILMHPCYTAKWLCPMRIQASLSPDECCRGTCICLRDILSWFVRRHPWVQLPAYLVYQVTALTNDVS